MDVEFQAERGFETAPITFKARYSQRGEAYICGTKVKLVIKPAGDSSEGEGDTMDGDCNPSLTAKEFTNAATVVDCFATHLSNPAPGTYTVKLFVRYDVSEAACSDTSPEDATDVDVYNVYAKVRSNN